MELAPRLIDVTTPADPEGLVLVLHGGASRGGRVAVSPTQLSVLRMVPIARRLARAGQGRLSVVRLLNSVRGWDSEHTPVDDVRWALARLADRHGTALPTCLVGHSLGGRAALLAAGQKAVRSVAALNPWVYADDVPRGVDGRRVLIVHGDADRVASPERSRRLARALDGRVDVTYVAVAGAKHAMLRRSDVFETLAAELAAGTLLGLPTPRLDALTAAGSRMAEA